MQRRGRLSIVRQRWVCERLVFRPSLPPKNLPLLYESQYMLSEAVLVGSSTNAVCGVVDEAQPNIPVCLQVHNTNCVYALHLSSIPPGVGCR